MPYLNLYTAKLSVNTWAVLKHVFVFIQCEYKMKPNALLMLAKNAMHLEHNQRHRGWKSQAGFLRHLFGVPDLHLEAQMQLSTRLPGGAVHAQREAMPSGALSPVSPRLSSLRPPRPLHQRPPTRMHRPASPPLHSTAAGKVVWAMAPRWRRRARAIRWERISSSSRRQPRPAREVQGGSQRKLRSNMCCIMAPGFLKSVSLQQYIRVVQ